MCGLDVQGRGQTWGRKWWEPIDTGNKIALGSCVTCGVLLTQEQGDLSQMCWPIDTLFVFNMNICAYQTPFADVRISVQYINSIHTQQQGVW